VDGGGAGSVGCGVSGGGGEGIVAGGGRGGDRGGGGGRGGVRGGGTGGGTGDEAAVAVSLLSTRRLALLALSRLLLPVLACMAVAVVAAVLRNHRETSSPLPSVFSTSLAGIPSSLQLTHALYCEKAHGGGRGVEPVLVSA